MCIDKRLMFTEDVLDKYQFPKNTFENEIASFNVQSDKFNMKPAPDSTVIRRALDRLELMYAPSVWTIRDDFCSDEHIKNVIENVAKESKKKNSGAVFCRQGTPTNEEVFKKLSIDGVFAMTKERIENLLVSEESLDSLDKMSDPIRVFIKKEHHKKAKIESKRLRLIWGVSLIDQIIDRILYQPMLDKAIEKYKEIPSKVGMSFKHGGVNNLVVQYENKSENWESFDAHSYDFTVSGWKQDVILQLNERLLQKEECAALAKWRVLSKARHFAINNCSFAFSNGACFRQTKPGRQNSGHLLTIDNNCKGTVLDRVLYDIHKNVPTNKKSIIVMGDDSVQDGLDSALDYCKWVEENCGVELTVEGKRGKFSQQNFCSTDFKLFGSTWVSNPRNWMKTVASICNYEKKKAKVQPEALDSIAGEYVFNENFDWLHSKLRSMHPAKCRSKQYYQSLHLGYEVAANSTTSQ